MTGPGPAQFGREITDGFKLTEEIVVADPIKSCAAANNGNEFWGKIVLVERGDCMFVEKARVLESQGAKGGIVLDNNPESDSNGGSNMFAMSGDGTGGVTNIILFYSLYHNLFSVLGPRINKICGGHFLFNRKLGGSL